MEKIISAGEKPPESRIFFHLQNPLPAVVGVLTAVFIPASLYRLVNVDEGYYLLASKLVLEGKTLYHDFFHTQMPLLPHVYGLWMGLFGVSWYSARIFTCAVAVAVGVLLYLFSTRLFAGRNAPFLSVLLYAFSSFSFAYLTVVKTYALSLLFLFSAYMAICARNDRPGKFFASGILTGLACDTRLTMLGAVPAFLYWIFRHDKNRQWKTASSIWFVFGISLAVSVNLYFIYPDADRFFFNNLGYHLIRSDLDFAQSAANKIATLFSLVTDLHFLPLLLANIVLFKRGMKDDRVLLSFYIFIMITITGLAPNRIYAEYWCVAAPFMIIGGVGFFRTNAGKGAPSGGLSAKMAPVLLGLYFLASPYEYVKYMYWGHNVPAVDSYRYAPNWRISNIRKVSSAIDKYAGKGETVIALWPGYLVESRGRPLPGLENNFGMIVSPKLTDAAREKFHIISPEELAKIIRSRRHRVAVLGNSWVSPLVIDALKASGYGIADRIGDAYVLALPRPDRPPDDG